MQAVLIGNSNAREQSRCGVLGTRTRKEIIPFASPMLWGGRNNEPFYCALLFVYKAAGKLIPVTGDTRGPTEKCHGQIIERMGSCHIISGI